MAFSTAALTQNDYIVTLKNDTLRGEITKPLIGKLRFKETEGSKPLVISEKNKKGCPEGMHEETIAGGQIICVPDDLGKR